MTREELIKAMADAIEKLVLKNDRDGKSLTSYPDTATAALSSLESLGLAIVPVTATDAMLDEFIEHGFKADDYSYGLKPENIYAAYAAMLSASPLRKTDGEGT